MKKKHGLQSLCMAPRAAGFALATVLPLAVSTASAFELNLGAVTGSLDTTLSYGTGWRMEAQDKNLAALYPTYRQLAQADHATFANKNDGNANFDNDSKPISSTFKITSDFELKYNNYGVFLRGTAFYDTVIMDETPNRSQPNPFQNCEKIAVSANPANLIPTSCGFTSKVDEHSGTDARFLDAYVYGNFDVAGRGLNVRLGEQVVNWGEALFLQDGINSANPVSLSRLRVPGAEVREALLPLPMIYGSYELADSLSVEAFFEFDWDYSEADDRGTYYSTDDAFAGFGADQILNNLQPDLNLFVTSNRRPDQPVDNAGQFGVAFRYNTDSTEYGLFYMNYHSHKPVAQAFTGISGQGQAVYLATTEYQLVYPEDIHMMGLSFSTTLGGLSLSGELAYRPNDVILSELGDNLVAYNILNSAFLSAGLPVSLGDTLNDGNLVAPNGVLTGEAVKVWEELETYNLDLVAINNFGPILGADGVIAVLEVGASYIPKGEDNRYASTASLLNIPLDSVHPAIQASPLACQNPDQAHYESTVSCISEGPSDDYLDDFSWGYRAVISATYNDVFAGVALNPVIRLAHDVDGNSHRTGNFQENRKSGLVGVNAIYNNALEVGIAYNTFWGAEASNFLHDRDNLTLTLKYSF